MTVKNGKKWSDVPAGDYTTGVNKLLQELNLDGELVLTKLKDDPVYTRQAARSLVSLAKGRAQKSGDMMTIKQCMGTRCFLPIEIQRMLNIPEEEQQLLPDLTESQAKKLLCFLRKNCTLPGLTRYENWQTHLLFPMPGILHGITLHAGEFINLTKSNPIITVEMHTLRDPQFGHVRRPRWYLLAFTPDGSNGVEAGPSTSFTDQEAFLNRLGYSVTDPTLLAFALTLWHRRTNELAPNGQNTHVRTAATGESRDRKGRVIVGRTVKPEIRVYIESEPTSAVGAYRLVDDQLR